MVSERDNKHVKCFHNEERLNLCLGAMRRCKELGRLLCLIFPTSSSVSLSSPFAEWADRWTQAGKQKALIDYKLEKFAVDSHLVFCWRRVEHVYLRSFLEPLYSLCNMKMSPSPYWGPTGARRVHFTNESSTTEVKLQIYPCGPHGFI